MENKIKILVVDDDEPTRKMYAEILAKNDFEVSEAVDGLDGLEKAIKILPHIVFTGIIMPRMDGFSLITELKKNVSTSNIPVVISSHLGREEDQKKAKEMGVKDFIARDFVTPKEAVLRIKAALNLNEYQLRIDPASMDAPKLAKDLRLNEKFSCISCGEEMILRLKENITTEEYSAKFICPKCERK